jgi:hypothetical protein
MNKYFIRDAEVDGSYEPITLKELEKILKKWEIYNEDKMWYDMYAIRLEKVENGNMYFGVAPNEL